MVDIKIKLSSKLYTGVKTAALDSIFLHGPNTELDWLRPKIY
jgi:hypothetical protein